MIAVPHLDVLEQIAAFAPLVEDAALRAEWA